MIKERQRLRVLLPLIFLLSLSLVHCATTEVTEPKEKARALENMGRSLVRQGNLRDGLAHLLKAVELDPENPDMHHELALVYRDLGEYGISLEHFKKALDLRPRFPEAWNNLGTLYLLMTEWDLAIEAFEIAVSDILYKTPEIAYNNLGLVSYRKGEYERAVRYYLMALEELPSYAPCHTNLGLAYEALERWDDAVDSYNRSIQYEPEYPAPYLLLGKLYYRFKMRKEALEPLKQFLGLVKEGPRADEARDLIRAIEGR